MKAKPMNMLNLRRAQGLLVIVGLVVAGYLSYLKIDGCAGPPAWKAAFSTAMSC